MGRLGGRLDLEWPGLAQLSGGPQRRFGLADEVVPPPGRVLRRKGHEAALGIEVRGASRLGVQQERQQHPGLSLPRQHCAARRARKRASSRGSSAGLTYLGMVCDRLLNTQPGRAW